MEELSRVLENAMVCPSGDQAGMSPPRLPVRFRCPLPSAFTTKISVWQTPHCPMAGPRRFSKASLSPSGDHTGRHDGSGPTRCIAHQPALAAPVGVHDVELGLQESARSDAA